MVMTTLSPQNQLFSRKRQTSKEHYIVQDFYAIFQRKTKIFSVFPKNFFRSGKIALSVKCPLLLHMKKPPDLGGSGGRDCILDK